MLGLLAFISGLFFGSFFNVIVDRLYRNEGFLTGRSYCEKCKHILVWYDLVPLISYLFLKGKCRYCHSNLTWYYPISELMTGIIFLLTACLISGNNAMTILYTFLVVSCLIIVFLMDAKYGFIPFVVVLPLCVLSLCYWAFMSPLLFLQHLLSGFGSFFFLFLLFAGTRGRGMGFGDVIFALSMGLLLGFPLILLAHYIAFLTGAFLSTILILLKRKKLKGSTIPFGPFLVLGTYICLLWGDVVMHYITRMFL